MSLYNIGSGLAVILVAVLFILMALGVISLPTQVIGTVTIALLHMLVSIILIGKSL